MLTSICDCCKRKKPGAWGGAPGLLRLDAGSFEGAPFREKGHPAVL